MAPLAPPPRIRSWMSTLNCNDIISSSIDPGGGRGWLCFSLTVKIVIKKMVSECRNLDLYFIFLLLMQFSNILINYSVISNYKFVKKIGQTHVHLWGYWYPCFASLVMSPLGFIARVDSALFAFFAEV